MANRDIARLAFVMAGIYVLTIAIASLETLFYFASNLTETPTTQSAATVGTQHANAALATAAAVVSFLFLTMAAILILGSRRLALRAFPESSEQQPPRPPFLALHAFAYSIVGLVFVAEALPRVMYMLSLPFQAGSISGWWQYWTWELTGAAAQFLFGVALFFGSHGLVRLWSRLRYSGIRRQMGLCIRCGYDLTGNTTGICPECGTRQTVEAQ